MRHHFAHVQRPTGARGIKFRSKAEANYAAYLEWLRTMGKIADWRYESIEMWFTPLPPPVRKGRKRATVWNNPAHLGLTGIMKGRVTYVPDFAVDERRQDGRIVSHFVEVKGYMDARSKTTLARARRYFPDSRFEVIDSKTMRTLARQVGAVVPGWLP